MQLSAVREKRTSILACAQRHGAEDVRVFGSTARGEARADSDVDFLVSMAPGRSFLDVVALERDLTSLLGRPAEVLTTGAVHDLIRDQVESEAVEL